jgi:hypothetical protein
LAQEILTKKLGNLSPTTETSSSDMFNSLARYFEQPLPRQRMEALMAQEVHHIYFEPWRNLGTRGSSCYTIIRHQLIIHHTSCFMEIKSDLVQQRKAPNASRSNRLQKYVAGVKWRITSHFHRSSENVERSILLKQYQLMVTIPI